MGARNRDVNRFCALDTPHKPRLEQISVSDLFALLMLYIYNLYNIKYKQIGKIKN